MLRKKRTLTPASVADLLIKLLLLLVFMGPFYICVCYAFKSPEETIRTGLMIPTGICWENFAKAIEVSDFFTAMKNSLIVTVCSILLLMFVASTCAYVIARNLKSRLYQGMYYVFLAAIMLPFQVVMLPLYMQLKDMGLLNTRIGLILTISGFQLAYNIFVYVGFIRGIPEEMEEAAFLDGAGKITSFWRIVFPLMKPILSSSLVLNALTVWNDFQISLIIAQKTSIRTIPMTQYFFFGQYSMELNMAFAAFLLAMIPIIILYLVMQKYIISGVMAGAVKG